jgi:hypothetical protein
MTSNGDAWKIQIRNQRRKRENAPIFSRSKPERTGHPGKR